MLVNSQAKQIVNQYIGYTDAVAAGSGDNTAVVNASGVDCKNYSSALILVQGTTTLGDAETLALTLTTTDSADNSSFAAKETLASAATIATGGGGGSTEVGYAGYVIDLDDYARYVKFSFTPNLSAGSADTADLSYSVVLCNANELPASVPAVVFA